MKQNPFPSSIAKAAPALWSICRSLQKIMPVIQAGELSPETTRMVHVTVQQIRELNTAIELADEDNREGDYRHAFLVKAKSGTFRLYQSKDVMKMDIDSWPDEFPDTVSCQEVLVDYNNGQPVIQLGDFKMTVAYCQYEYHESTATN